MVTLCLLACSIISSNGFDGNVKDENSSKLIKSALKKCDFPWYDSKRDAIRRIDPGSEKKEETTASEPLKSGSGQILALVGFATAMALLIGLLVWFWRINEPGTDLPKLPTIQKQATQADVLPDGMQREFALDDAWAEALRRKSRGDLAGAVICLFAHQLLTLSKLGVVRLAPGRTGRQLVRAVTDGELKMLVQPTLRLFEVVYYGHREPTESEFAAIWNEAEAFERRVASGGVR